MTKDEVRNMMKYFQATYKGFCEGMDIGSVLNVWFDIFRDVDKGIAQIAARNHVMTSKYPPTPADVMKQIGVMMEPDDTDLWVHIERATRNGIYGAGEEFANLPPECQSFLCSPEALKELAQCDAGTINTIVKGQFMKYVPQIRDHQAVQRGLPMEVRAAINESKTRMITSE